MTKSYIDLGKLGKKADHQMSKDEILQYHGDRLDWLQSILLGQRDENGKFVKTEHRDKDGKVKQVGYSIGLLQKFEGARELDETTQEEKLIMPGMEHLFQNLGNKQNETSRILEQLAGEMVQTQLQLVALMLKMKIDPVEFVTYLNDEESAINTWITNFRSTMEKNLADQAKAEKETGDKLKDLQPNDDKDQIS